VARKLRCELFTTINKVNNYPWDYPCSRQSRGWVFLLAFVCFSARHLKTVSAKISKSKLDVEMFPMSPGKPFILESKGQR